MEPTIAPPRPRRWRKRLMALLAIAVIVLASVVVSIPWLVNRPFIKARIVRQVNAILAPGRASFKTISVSWFGTSAVTDFELFDHEDRRVLTATRATLDWNLFQTIFARPKVANITLIEGQADIAREQNGEINLIDTIRPFLVPKPKHTVIVRLPHGTVRLRPSRDARPLIGEDADVMLEFAAYPEPIRWDVTLTQPRQGGTPGSLALRGQIERVTDGDNPPDVELTVSGERWAWSNDPAGSALTGTIGGDLEARRTQGRWSSSGQATLADFAASAKAIDGNNPPFRLETTKAEWKVVEKTTDWEIQKLRVESPFGTLDARGTVAGKPGESWTMALDSDISGFTFADPLDPSKPFRETLKTSLKLAYDSQTDRVDLSGLDLSLPLIRIRGGGTVAGLTADRAVDLRGTIEPDWDALQKMLAKKIEPNARLAGRAKGWAITGTLPTLQVSEWSRTLEGEAGVELEQVDVFGMRLSRTAVVARFRNGELIIDPIDSTLNGGPLHLEPSLVTDDAGNQLLRLGSSSSLTDAEVNEEVSHRVLSYVAPVLDRATRVSGRVSVAIADAVLPLDPGATGIKPNVEGEVSFEQVEFAPGRFADMIFGVLPIERKPILVLDQPVSLKVVDGRVYQEGLAIPMGKLAEIGLDGWVGFDRTLNLTASVTLTPDKSEKEVPILSSIFRGTRVAIPIRGTFDDPKLDTKAIGQNFKDLGAGLLGKTLSSASGGMIPNIEGLKNLFGGGGRNQDGDEIENPLSSLLKPRFTPEERRARRQERKLERMRKRGRIP
jgi:hypothetical protein